MKEVNAQHRLDRKRRAASLALRVVRLDERDQFPPRHHPCHLVEKFTLAGVLR
jgi:hypothetical protein